MAENSNISWTDHTFNPWIGCTKVSPGCANCYADTQDRLRKWTPEGWGKGKPRKRTSKENWIKPLRWNHGDFRECILCGWRGFHDGICCCPNPKCPGEPIHLPDARPRVFCASLSDWLDDEVPIEWLADLLKLIHDTPNLDWLLLTKRPGNWTRRMSAALECLQGESEQWLKGWLLQADIPPRVPQNVWIGTTTENQEEADKRIPELLKIPAKVRFLSCEPLLSEADLTMALEEFQPLNPDLSKKPAPIQWVIAGGESGPNRREMNLDWLRTIHNQCKAAGVAFFCKQDSAFKPGQKGRIPDDLWVQEFPK